jgi:collagen beta-1,O-galactosyltransferase
MNNRYIKKIMIILLIIHISIYIYKINYNTESIKFKSINNSFLINLPHRKDRLESFKQLYTQANINIPLHIHTAVNGKKLKLEDIHITRLAKKEITDSQTLGYRTKHYQLTMGGIGCYLSHVGLWNFIYNKGIDYALIFEDDASIPPDFIENLNISIKNMNKADPDWDILFLDALCRDCIPYQDNIVKINKFYLMHAYIIRRKTIKKMFDYKMLFPINQQIDWCIGSHSNILKLYTVTNGFVKQGGFSTDIQIGIKKQKGVNPNDDAPSV